ncbi:hypothetical protein DPEC_G00269240 [Dallia pectoralis]|uniref:Uncharacterized protein n=1 Tax=Dallia pectoralis TaxID=75939 RepID=A0ACC2FP89_DALPE|nr:hypothetical protein DPEC_G00269240 [Dallia pectoralis]
MKEQQLTGLKSMLGWSKHREMGHRSAKRNDTPVEISPKVLQARCAVPKLTPEQRMRQTPFERVLYDMNHDQRVIDDLTMGRRTSFYELRGEIGCGNFSQVRLGIHALSNAPSELTLCPAAPAAPCLPHIV